MSTQDDFKKTLSYSLLQMASRPNGRIAIQFKNHQKWITLSWADFYSQIKVIANQLAFLQLKRQQKVAIIAHSSLEWILMDAATVGLGLISLAIPVNVHSDDLKFILENERPNVIYVDDAQTLKILQKILLTIGLKCQIFTNFETPEIQTQFLSLTNLIAQSDHFVSRYYFEEQLQRANETEIVTQIYTSHTNGRLKSINLTHRNILSQISETFPLLSTNPDDLTISFLPYSHILGRTEVWGHWYIGYQLIVAPSPERLRHLMKEFNPTFLMATPRIFEKIYALAQIQISRSWWLDHFLNPILFIQKKSKLWLINKSARLLTDTVFNQIQRLFGRRLRFAFCGGAPLSQEIAQFFSHAGVLILEGYGMSETTGALTVNRPYDYELGSVGKPIGDVQLKLAADGEILVRSKKISASVALTSEGWMATGDLGQWSPQGNLIILDRKQSLIKTQQGKFVSPEKLRLKLKNHPLIDQVYFHGNDRPFIVALISLDLEKCHQWLLTESKEITFTQQEKDLIIQNEIHNYIQKVNKSLQAHEQIKRFAVSPIAFTQENGYLSPSQKIKSNKIQTDFAQLLTKLYH